MITLLFVQLTLSTLGVLCFLVHHFLLMRLRANAFEMLKDNATDDMSTRKLVCWVLYALGFSLCFGSWLAAGLMNYLSRGLLVATSIGLAILALAWALFKLLNLFLFHRRED